MKFSYFIIFLLFNSCYNQEANSSKVDRVKHDTIAKPNINDCIPRDTIVGNIGLMYLKRDTFFSVKVMIDKRDSILSYEFNCSTPPVLIPSLYSVSKDILCLKRGYGQEYREFIICFNVEEKMTIKKYETALVADLTKGIVVYQDYDNNNNVYVENIKSGSRKAFTIPSKIISRHVSNTTIINDKLKLKFTDDKEVEFLLR